MEPVTLIVTYTMQPDAAAQFVAEVTASGLLAQIRAENGCQRYDYLYPSDGNTRLVLIEGWASAKHQATHMAQPHMAQLAAIKDKYVTDTKIEKLMAMH